MTRKHFEAIAAAIALSRNSLNCDPAYIDAINATAYNIACTLAEFNPSFDEDRFMKATGA